VRFPSLGILVASGHGGPATAALALRSGARGFISKMRPMCELVDGLRTVAARKCYIDKTMTYDLEQVAKGVPIAEHDAETTLAGQSSLSPREQEVLRCVLNGMPVTSIAKKFSRSVNTISTQKQAAYRKLGIRSDAELFKIQKSLV
jgi:two-component system, NarL family, captular synthesis response regulator RcsB